MNKTFFTLVFFICFLGLSSETIAQSTNTVPNNVTFADESVQDLFHGTTYVDESIAMARALNEKTILETSNPTGLGEAEHDVTAHFFVMVASHLKHGNTVPDALLHGYYAAQTYGAEKYSSSEVIDYEAILTNVANTLD